MKKKKTGDRITLVIGTLLAILALLPLIWAFSASFQTNQDIFANLAPFSIHTFIPEHFTLESYINIFAKYHFFTAVLNTLVIALITIVLGVLISSMAAFALTKMRFKGSSFFSMVVLFAIMVPFEAIAIPLYSLVDAMHMVDTMPALVLPALANGMAIFLFQQFFRDIPDSLIEAASLDGAGPWRIFFTIIMPISKPTIISASLIFFMSQWDAFLWPVLVAKAPQLRMVQVALTDFKMEHGTMWSEMFAASIIAALVPCLILLPLQKYYVRGITSSGIKE